MTNRRERIVYELANASGPLTSQQLADSLGVSIRTIKYEIGLLRTELDAVGAAVLSKRNVGYVLKITAPELFRPFNEKLSMKKYFHEKKHMDDSSLLLNFLRLLVSLSAHTSWDQLAETLYASRSTLHRLTKEATAFLASYHLEIDTCPGIGIMVKGEEQHLRLAITELYSYHYHKIDLEDVQSQYARWIMCSTQQRQDIRHTLLRELRGSGISLLDSSTQRFSIYLIVARNRLRCGNGLKLPASWKKTIAACDVFPVAQRIFAVLHQDYDGFDEQDGEIEFFAIMMLCYRDMGHLTPGQFGAPFLFSDSRDLAGVIFAEVYARHGVRLDCSPWAETELQNHLVPIMGKQHFGLDQMLYFGSTDEMQIFHSPVSISFSRTIIYCIEQVVGTELAYHDKIKIAYFTYKIISLANYDIKKLDLLIVNATGISFGKVMEQRLLESYGRYINSCTCMQLYEIRGIDQSRYDGVIMEMGGFSYNYSLPYANLTTIGRPFQLKHAFNTVISYAVRSQAYLPSPDNISVLENFIFQDISQFFQFLSYKHCTNPIDRAAMEQLLTLNEKLFFMRPASGTAMVFGGFELTGTEAIELYRLKKTGLWNGERIDNILYVCLDWKNNLTRVKVIENSLMMMMEKQYIDCIASQKATAFEEAFRAYLSPG